jgi:hypothetical protein
MDKKLRELGSLQKEHGRKGSGARWGKKYHSSTTGFEPVCRMWEVTPAVQPCFYTGTEFLILALALF